MKRVHPLIFLLLLCSCAGDVENNPISKEEAPGIDTIDEISLVVLGTIQDAGSPHIACEKDCCKDLFDYPDANRKVVCLGLIDPLNDKKYLFEATPDLPEQMQKLKSFAPFNEQKTPDGIFLTHAHIGHYAGLMYLGKEAMSSDNVPVYVMPRMKSFLEQNGPWSQLVANDNISLVEINENKKIELSSELIIVPFTVPHRDEYSETVGYTIIGPTKKVLFIPDIDKWNKWELTIIEEISKVDYAFIDATFYDGDEINNRDISEIPHPFIIESMALFKDLPGAEKAKIYFTHFNHTNPVLNENSPQAKQVIENGFKLAEIYTVIKL